MRERAPSIADEWLVLQSQDGDLRAFERLASRWQERLWRHARRLVREDAAASDVVQEAWMSMLKGLRRLEDPAAFAQWAYRIVTFKCVDHVRRSRRQRKAEESRPMLPVDPHGDCEGDDITVLRAALGELTVDQRAILSLHYRSGRFPQLRDRCPAAGVHPEPEVHVVGRSRGPAMIISSVIRSRRTGPLQASRRRVCPARLLGQLRESDWRLCESRAHISLGPPRLRPSTPPAFPEAWAAPSPAESTGRAGPASPRSGA